MDHPSTYRVVYVEPGKPACEKEIGSDLKSLQEAVGGGLIECVYPHRDNTLIVCNDEGKLIGMEGNRRLDNGSIIAGPFFVVGEAGDDFRSLTDAEVSRYLQKYAEPHQISLKEVQADMRWTIIFLGGKAVNIQARIDRLVQVGNVKAIASVSLDGMFVVKGLKVMDGRKGLFVSMPQETFSGKDGQKQYSNLFFPLTNSAKSELQEAVLDAYRLRLDPNHQPRHNPKQQYNPERQYPEPGYREPGFREPGYRDFHEDHEGLPFMGMY